MLLGFQWSEFLRLYQVPSRALGNEDVTQASRDVLTFLLGGGGGNLVSSRLLGR